jgi:hypothetical protein
LLPDLGKIFRSLDACREKFAMWFCGAGRLGSAGGYGIAAAMVKAKLAREQAVVEPGKIK